MKTFFSTASLASALGLALLALPLPSQALETATSGNSSELGLSNTVLDGILAPLNGSLSQLNGEIATRTSEDNKIRQELATLQGSIATMRAIVVQLTAEYDRLRVCVPNGSCVNEPTTPAGTFETMTTDFTVRSKRNSWGSNVDKTTLDTNLKVAEWPFCAITGRNDAGSKNFMVEPGSRGTWIVRIEDSDAAYGYDQFDGTVSANCFRIK